MAPHRWVCLIFLLMLLAEVPNAAALKVSTTAVFHAVPYCWQQDDDFEVLVRVEAPLAAKRRTPIDLVAVLDVSSSMNAAATPSDTLSRLDLLKRGMKFIIDKLDDTDRLAIVAFNDEVVEEYGIDLLYMAGGGRRDARRHVDELMARGNTAFRPGLEKAVKILDERAADRDRVGFIVLLSDGIDNSEIKWTEEHVTKRSKLRAALRRYPVHTFGFSAAHDPNALLFIAQESRGTYSFVNENLDRITSAFAVCLGGLKSVVAADARVRLTTTSAERSGGVVRIRSVESGGYRSHVSGDGTSGEIVIGVLYAGEVKTFIVRLHVPSGESSVAFSERRQQLLLTAAAVSGVVEGGYFGDQSQSLLQVERPGRLDGAAVQLVPSAVVVNHIVRFRLVETVARFVRDEVVAAAAAIDHNSAQELGNRLQSRWEEFKEEHKFWSGVDMSSLEEDINAMVSGLQRGGAGVAYICSWLSSYQMQRATTMGSPEKVAAEFLTPEMRLMLKEASKIKKQPLEVEVGTTVPPPRPGRSRPEPAVNVGDLDMIDRRLELWSSLKRDMALMFQLPAEETAGTLRRLDAVFREASLEAIDRAMHHDVYLAVVHASNLRRCYSGGHHAWEEAAAHGYWSVQEQRVEFASSATA